MNFARKKTMDYLAQKFGQTLLHTPKRHLHYKQSPNGDLSPSGPTQFKSNSPISKLPQSSRDKHFASFEPGISPNPFEMMKIAIQQHLERGKNGYSFKPKPNLQQNSVVDVSKVTQGKKPFEFNVTDSVKTKRVQGQVQHNQTFPQSTMTFTYKGKHLSSHN